MLYPNRQCEEELTLSETGAETNVISLPQRNDIRHLASGIYLLLFGDIDTLQI